jgi:hypothetical protein
MNRKLKRRLMNEQQHKQYTESNVEKFKKQFLRIPEHDVYIFRTARNFTVKLRGDSAGRKAGGVEMRYWPAHTLQFSTRRSPLATLSRRH